MTTMMIMILKCGACGAWCSTAAPLSILSRPPCCPSPRASCSHARARARPGWPVHLGPHWSAPNHPKQLTAAAGGNQIGAKFWEAMHLQPARLSKPSLLFPTFPTPNPAPEHQVRNPMKNTHLRALSWERLDIGCVSLLRSGTLSGKTSCFGCR